MDARSLALRPARGWTLELRADKAEGGAYAEEALLRIGDGGGGDVLKVELEEVRVVQALGGVLVAVRMVTKMVTTMAPGLASPRPVR